MPVLHGKPLNLSLQFRLPALLLLLLGILLFFLLNIALHLAELRVVGEIASQLKDQPAGLIVVVALAGGFDTSHLMAEYLLLDLGGCGITHGLRLACPEQGTAVGRAEILRRCQRLGGIAVRCRVTRPTGLGRYTFRDPRCCRTGVTRCLGVPCCTCCCWTRSCRCCFRWRLRVSCL